MKRYSKIYFCLITLVIVSGCDKYLEETPDNRVELNTPQKAAQLLTNAYSGAGYLFTEWMSDNVSFTQGTFKQPEHNQLYEWKEPTSIEQDTPTNFWTSTYDAIAHANEVLAVIDNLTGEKSLKDAVKGEAYLTRAYGHFMLVNLFAKHYNPETASQDLGIPYVLEPETEFIKKYTRSTVEEVYDYIEDDIEEGLDLVDASYYAGSGKYHFTPNAALAFASRFYLFKGDWDNCIKYSSQMLGAEPAIFIKDIATLLAQTPNSDDFIRQYTSPNDPSNLLMIRNVTNFPVNVGHWPDQPLFFGIFNNNPMDADDIRVSAEFPLYQRGEGGLTQGKFEFLFERSSLTSDVGLYYTIISAFRGEEVLLNRAESYVFKNEISLALADLQLYISRRYEGNPTLTLQQLRTYYESNNNQFVTLSFIIDERRKEFMHEGLRWFDIKRYQIPVRHFLENGTPIQLEGDDKRQVLQLPQTALDVGGLEANPR
ncbi:RagB/SusD family nutrient uptake outer membrane protein [Chryseolinea sp. H1M3-3]|uniref:RagB/SusD family nutrient uptake outer membrane protein n=1 Tax=Chryseolinea sp. H1M3-3 TaxID=3034144 RepID=UPI0023ED697D|nr:RagB/SusD family nutrient uptake outer membrane protein [Chryseolinea sp. H1M3-3]